MSGLVGDGVAPVKIDFGCVDIERPVCLDLYVGARASQHARLCQSAGILSRPRSAGNFQLEVNAAAGQLGCLECSSVALG